MQGVRLKIYRWYTCYTYKLELYKTQKDWILVESIYSFEHVSSQGVTDITEHIGHALLR